MEFVAKQPSLKLCPQSKQLQVFHTNGRESTVNRALDGSIYHG